MIYASNFQIFYLRLFSNPKKYVSPFYCRAEMYAGRVACCPLVSAVEYADGTSRQTGTSMFELNRYQQNA